LQKSLDNIEVLTGSTGHLNEALANVDQLTTEVLRGDRVGKTLNNLQSTTQNLDGLVSSVAPRVEIIAGNLQQASDTIKHQPWRLIWPSTKKYPSPSPIRRGL
jgi:ABC-type transporter Mla subunit MlaD